MVRYRLHWWIQEEYSKYTFPYRCHVITPKPVELYCKEAKRVIEVQTCEDSQDFVNRFSAVAGDWRNRYKDSGYEGIAVENMEDGTCVVFT